LLPLDLDEARSLLDCQDRMPAADLHDLETLHRDEGGNPRRMMRLWRKRSEFSADLAIEPRSAVPNLPSTATTLSATASEPAGDQSIVTAGSHVASEVLTAIPDFELGRGTPAWTESRSLVPSRPPLRVEDGLVEVGWKESFEAETAAMKPTEGEQPLSPLPPVVEGDESASEEIIEDHYAALQAWTEWARNRGRMPEPAAASAQPQRPSRAVETADLDEPAETPAAAPLSNAAIRAEPQHEHAPYSQLFSRLRQSR
jgi:general secretion pathway protein A